MSNKDSKNRNELIAVLLIIVSGIVFFLSSNKMVTISASDWNVSYQDLIDELYKYNCSIVEKNDESNIVRHYATNDSCAFEMDYLENIFYNDGHFEYYLDKVNDNGNGNKTEYTYSINGSLVSKESTGLEKYKYVSYKKNTILYLSTMKSFKDNANLIRSDLGYKYSMNIHWQYVIIPVLLFIAGIVFIVFPTNKRKKIKGRKK